LVALTATVTGSSTNHSTAIAIGTASSRHQPGIARISVAAPQASRTTPVTSTTTAAAAAASSRFRQMRADRTRARRGARDPECESRRAPADAPGPVGEPDGPGGHHDDQQDARRLPSRGAADPGQHGESYPLGSKDG
jgi:hypothetical protein